MQHVTTDDRWREYHVTPRYLAGSSGIGDPGFAPVPDWPHHYLDDGPCQVLVTSPDHRIRIGWYGDDYELWKIAAAEALTSTPRWTATFNQNTPPEIVAGLTAALARDWAAGNDGFLTRPSLYWSESVAPLLDAGWARDSSKPFRPRVTAPDQLAGAWIDRDAWRDDGIAVTLWSGPAGWGTRMEAEFTAQTPSHLIAATAAAMADPAPLVRERGMLHRNIEPYVQLSPVDEPATPAKETPTPLDVRRTAVTAALQRASHDQDRRRTQSNAARARTSSAVGRTVRALPTGEAPVRTQSASRTTKSR